MLVQLYIHCNLEKLCHHVTWFGSWCKISMWFGIKRTPPPNSYLPHASSVLIEGHFTVQFIKAVLIIQYTLGRVKDCSKSGNTLYDLIWPPFCPLGGILMPHVCPGSPPPCEITCNIQFDRCMYLLLPWRQVGGSIPEIRVRWPEGLGGTNQWCASAALGRQIWFWASWC